MPKVPTITPGPDDTGHAPQDATETIPLITSVTPASKSTNERGGSGISDDEALQSSRPNARSADAKSSFAAALRPASWAPSCSSPLSRPGYQRAAAGRDGPVTDMVTEGTFTTTVEAKGQLKPISASVVSPSVDGTVASINVQAGQSVNEGDVLMTIKNDELDRNVAEAQRAVAAAKEDLANAQKARSCRAGHSDDWTSRSSEGLALRRISRHERRLERPAQPRLGPGNPRPGQRQGRRAHRDGPQLG